MSTQLAPSRGRVAPLERNGPNTFTDQDKDEARTMIVRAFEVCGLGDQNGFPICPLCGKGGKNRLKFHEDGGFKCFSAQQCYGRRGGAIDLVMTRLSLSFPEALGLLLGRPVNVRSQNARPLPPPVVIATEADSFKAIVDSDVYEAIAAAGDHKLVSDYFGRWHITQAAIRDLGFFYVAEMAKLHKHLLATFGRDRLIACGVLMPKTETRGDYFVISDSYPVGEPHKSSDGRIVGLQFRGSLIQEARYKKHRVASAEKRAAEAAGLPARELSAGEMYVPKFMSLKGGTGTEHLVGGNLQRCALLEAGSTIYVVEGLKDAAALLSRGFEAYGLPGAGTLPPIEAMRILARHNLVLAFDADDGGDFGSENLMKAFARHGIITDEAFAQVAEGAVSEGELLPEDAHEHGQRALQWRTARSLRCYRKRPPSGMDIADTLAEHIATRSSVCNCPACLEHRTKS